MAPGIVGTARHQVTPAMSPPHLHPAEVLGTSTLVELMELAALESVAAGLAAGETTVGASISLQHLRPAFAGETVEIRSRLAATGSRLTFEITATVEDRLVGRATHERAIVDRARFVGAPAER